MALVSPLSEQRVKKATIIQKIKIQAIESLFRRRMLNDVQNRRFQ